MHVKALLFSIAGVLFITIGQGHSLESSSFPSLISSVRVEGPLEFCGERVPLELEEVRERLEKELLLSLWDRPQVVLWLKRSHRYFPSIEGMLRENGLPDDLKYVAVAESALRPHAGSKKGAVGFWQFMRDTGKTHGLTIDQYVDERRNLFASTRAAIRYFRFLRESLGSWTLAAAAYNLGEEGIRAEMLEQETDDYYRLYLPLETQRFVFRILSAKLIMSHPEKYGFRLTAEDYYLPLEFDRVEVECPQEIPIRIIAQAAKTTFKVIKDLNPEIRGHYLAPGIHTILVPKGPSTGFSRRYQELTTVWLSSRQERIYVVQKGDSLSSIADQFGVPLAALIIWNRIDLTAPIHPGDQLVIYRGEGEGLQPDETEEPAEGDGGETKTPDSDDTSFGSE